MIFSEVYIFFNNHLIQMMTTPGATPSFWELKFIEKISSKFHQFLVYDYLWKKIPTEKSSPQEPRKDRCFDIKKDIPDLFRHRFRS